MLEIYSYGYSPEVEVLVRGASAQSFIRYMHAAQRDFTPDGLVCRFTCSNF